MCLCLQDPSNAGSNRGSCGCCVSSIRAWGQRGLGWSSGSDCSAPGSEFSDLVKCIQVQDVQGLFLKCSLSLSQLLCGQEECVQSLLELEASVLLGDSRGRTAIHLAAARGHASWLSELLNIACSEPPIPPLRDNQGYTPLHWACYYGWFHYESPLWV